MNDSEMTFINEFSIDENSRMWTKILLNSQFVD